MPIYHFNLADGSYESDPDGTMLADLATARLEAVAFAGSYLRDYPDIIWEGHKFRVEVTDHAGADLFAVVVSTETSKDAFDPQMDSVVSD